MDRGGLTGTIKDSSGLVVPGAFIKAMQNATGLLRTAFTSGSGTYDIPELPVGTYTVAISGNGLQTVRFETVIVSLEHTTILNVALRASGPADNVEVTDSDQQLDETSDAMGERIERKQISELLLNGRNWATLTWLAPLAVDTNYGNSSDQRSIRVAGRGRADNAAAFATPAPGTFGNVGRDILTGPGSWQLDFGLDKRIAVTERYRLQLRAEAFNLFNRAQLGAPQSNLSAGPGEFGVITQPVNTTPIGAGTPRQSNSLCDSSSEAFFCSRQPKGSPQTRYSPDRHPEFTHRGDDGQVFPVAIKSRTDPHLRRPTGGYLEKHFALAFSRIVARRDARSGASPGATW
jgi:hypothetical protein